MNINIFRNLDLQPIGIYIQKGIILIIVSICVFAATFFGFCIIFALIAPDYSDTISKPNFHLKKIDSQSLLTIYTNQQKKRQICELQSSDPRIYFDAIGFSFQQFCIFTHQQFPNSKYDVDVSLVGVNPYQIDSATGCIYSLNSNKTLACQKYRSTQTILLFNSIKLNQISYISIEIHLTQKNHQIIIIPQVHFNQNINMLYKFIKNNYSLISFIMSIFIAVMFTFASIVCQISLMMKYSKSGRQTKLKYF